MPFKKRHASFVMFGLEIPKAKLRSWWSRRTSI